MLEAKCTPNYAGVTLSGDLGDLKELNQAFHDIVGNEEKHPSLSSVHHRIMGLCYDLRHALLGDRGIKLVDNGMNTNKMKYHQAIAPQNNLYYSFNVIWLEILFVVMILNDYIFLDSNSIVDSGGIAIGNFCYAKLLAPEVMWNKSIVVIRNFQATVMEALKGILCPTIYSRLVKAIFKENLCFENYAIQYLDVLNARYLAMDREKRLKNLPSMVKHLSERSDEYYEIEDFIQQYSREHNITVKNIQLEGSVCPEEFDW